jgi:glycine cleavage system transcriptional repressor
VSDGVRSIVPIFHCLKLLSTIFPWSSDAQTELAIATKSTFTFIGLYGEKNMPNKFLLTAFSKDRPGIVADIAQLIYENGCNLEDSAMANLAGEFAMIFLFSPLSAGDEAELEALLSTECRRLERDKGITAFIRPVAPATAPRMQNIYTKTIYAEGLDHAGIVYKVSRFLADNQINIRTLNSEVKSSPESGAAIYSMKLVVEIPEKISIDILEKGLNQVGDQLQVDITIE